MTKDIESIDESLVEGWEEIVRPGAGGLCSSFVILFG